MSSEPMLDIEFLASDIKLDRSLIYRYRSGRLKSEVLAAIAQCAGAHGMTMILHGRGDPYFFEGGLLRETGLHWCDWAVRDASVEARSVRLAQGLDEVWSAALERLASGHPEKTVHFIGRKFDLEVLPIWADVARRCIIIEEGELNADRLRPYVRHLIARSALGITEAELEMIHFFEYVERRLEEGPLDLPALIIDIEMQFLTFMHPISRQRTPDRRRLAERRERYSLRTRLRRFLTTLAPIDMITLVSAAARLRQRNRWDGAMMVRELYRASSALFGTKSKAVSAVAMPRPAPPIDVTFQRHLFLWSATLLGWEARLDAQRRARRVGATRAPDSMIVVFDQMCRDLRSRCVEREMADRPLDDLWLVIERTMAARGERDDDPAFSQRAKLVGSIAEAGMRAMPNWMCALKRLATARLVEAEASLAAKSIAQAGGHAGPP